MSMLDIFAWLVLIVLLLSSVAVVVMVAMLPGMVATSRAESVLQAIASGQTQTSGTAVAPRAIVAAPFVVRIKLDDAAFADALPAGAVGDAAIFTDQVKPAHLIRRVILRQIAILNYVNPF